MAGDTLHSPLLVQSPGLSFHFYTPFLIQLPVKFVPSFQSWTTICCFKQISEVNFLAILLNCMDGYVKNIVYPEVLD